jgi:hypothetical protein
MEAFERIAPLRLADQHDDLTEAAVSINNEYMTLSYRAELIVIDVEGARAIRDWLNKALPAQNSGEQS